MRDLKEAERYCRRRLAMSTDEDERREWWRRIAWNETMYRAYEAAEIEE